MSKLLLTDELAEQFVACLLTIVRSDDRIDPVESVALHRVIADTLGGANVDFAKAMFMHVTLDSFAKAIKASGGSPYRGSSISPPEAIGKAFIEAAVQVADSGDGLTAKEVTKINRYARALGVKPVKIG